MNNKVIKIGFTVIFIILLIVSIWLTPYTSNTKLQSDNNPLPNNKLINNIKKITDDNYSTGVQGDISSTLRLVDPVSILIILVMAFLFLKAIEHI